MLGGGTKFPTLESVFVPGLPPVVFSMDECFHANGYEGEGGIVMLPVEVSIGKYVSVRILLTEH